MEEEPSQKNRIHDLAYNRRLDLDDVLVVVPSSVPLGRPNETVTRNGKPRFKSTLRLVRADVWI